MREDKNNEKHAGFDYKKSEIIIGIIIFLILAILIFVEAKILINHSKSDESTIDIFGVKPYLLSEDINELDIKKDSLILGDKNHKSNLQVLRVDSDKAEIIDDYHDYSNNDRYECEANSTTRILGDQIKLITQYFWIVFIVFVIYNLIYFAIYKNNIKNVFVIIRRVEILAILILTLLILNNIGYITNYSKANDNTVIDNSDNSDYQDNDQKQDSQDGKKQNNQKVDIDKEFIVTDDDTTWAQDTKLNIFDNKFYNTNKIAPGVYGDYRFDVKNLSDTNIKYNIKFSENNDYNVNLKYRLSKNGEYLSNDYQDITNLGEMQINSNDIDEYVLEWKWFDSDNDTEIGINAENVIYVLNIEINASYIV